MRKLLRLISILTLSLIPLGVLFVSAHPLDVSNTTLTLYPRSIEGVTYLHPAELDRILVNSGGADPVGLSVSMYYAMTGVLERYLSETLIVENEGKKCSIGNFSVMPGLMVDEVFRGGFPISYTLSCPDTITTPKITINICPEVQLQTNRLYIYEYQTGASPVRRDYRVLNVYKNSQIIILNAPVVMMDTDHDGISDEDERLYRTNPDDPDTDHDGYTDRTEIDASWNPLSSELSPGQSLYSQNMRNETLSSEMQSLPPVHSLAQDTTLWGGARFSAILTQIRIYVDDHGDWRSFGILLFSVFLLGFVHAIGPGHSKGILISQILDQHMSLSKGMLYSLIFSIFHLLDIIIVVLISKYLLGLFDPGKYLGSIQMMSIFLILGISIYLLIFSIRRILKKDSTREKDQKNRFFMGNNHIFLAIISGITPCAFGWSIFLLLFAVKRTDLALPLLLALGAGIFLCLLLVTLGTFLFKSSIYRFSPRLGLYSPVVSSVFLFGIGSFLLSQSF